MSGLLISGGETRACARLANDPVVQKAALRQYQRRPTILDVALLHSSLCPLLVDLLRLLPGVRPVRERYEFGEAKHRASLSPSRTADVNGVPVTLLQLDELFLDDQPGGPRVSQEGARLLLHLFSQGAFDPFDCRKVEGGLELLAQYSKGLATVIDDRFWRRGRRLAASHLIPMARIRTSGGRLEMFATPSHPRKPNATVHRLA